MLYATWGKLYATSDPVSAFIPGHAIQNLYGHIMRVTSKSLVNCFVCFRCSAGVSRKYNKTGAVHDRSPTIKFHSCRVRKKHHSFSHIILKSPFFCPLKYLLMSYGALYISICYIVYRALLCIISKKKIKKSECVNHYKG